MAEYQELLDELIKQEEELQFSEFTNETALKLGMSMIKKAQDKKLPIVIDISRHGQQLFHYAFHGTSPDNDQWIIRKNRVTNRFNKSSYRVGIFLSSIGKTLEEKYFISPLEYSAIGGSFPITVKNIGVVGTVAVSGLTQDEDHNVVVESLREFLENEDGRKANQCL